MQGHITTETSQLLLIDVIDGTVSAEVQWVCDTVRDLQPCEKVQLRLVERLCETAHTLPLALRMVQELPAVVSQQHAIFCRILDHIFLPTGACSQSWTDPNIWQSAEQALPCEQHCFARRSAIFW